MTGSDGKHVPVSRYLPWARRYFGQVEFDLAVSGMPTVPRAELGVPDSLDDPRGWARLRRAIATYNDVPVAESIATLGTSHALWLAYATLVSPGEDVLVERPGYEPLSLAAESVGARALRFERAQTDCFRLDPERIARAMTPRTRVIAVTNLHNPSGVRATDEALRAVAELADAHGAYLLVDEVYAPFDAFADPHGVFRTTARKLAANVVATSSLTKCFGLGLERIGWMLGPLDVIERAEHMITASVGYLPLAHANMAAHAFSRMAWLTERNRSALGTKRSVVEAWVRAQPRLWWSAPEAGLFGLAVSSGAGDLTGAIERGAVERGVVVAAGSFFGVPNGFRLAWSLPAQRLAEGLDRLTSVLASAAEG